MVIYTTLILTNILIGLLCRRLEINSNKSYVNIYLFLFFLTTFIISGFRSNTVGTDTKNYEGIFTSIYSLGYNYTHFWKSPGYSIYNMLLSKLSSNPQIITVTNSLVIMIGFTWIIKKFSVNPYSSSTLFITLYYYFITMNATRQYISIIFLVVSMYYFIDNKKIFILFFLLAISFHKISVVGLIYFLMYKINWDLKKYFILSIISTIISFNFLRVVTFFSKYFSDYENYVDSSLSINISSQGSGNKIFLSLFLFLFVILGIYIVYKNADNNDKLYRFLLGCTLISSILDFSLSTNIMAIRIIMYFNIFFILFIPSTIQYSSIFIREKLMYRILVSGTVIIFTLIPFYYQLSRNMVNVLPYNFFNFK